MTSKAMVFIFLISLGSSAVAQDRFECFIEPSRSVEVSSPTAGVLKSVKIDRGDTVSKGEIMAELVSDVERASLEVARARATNKAEVRARELSLEYERKRLERQEELRSRGIVSEQDYELVEGATELALSELDVAREDAALAQLELKRAEAIMGLRQIRSPIDGVVVALNVHEGEYAADDESVVSLISVDELHVEAFLPAAFYGRISVGDRALVKTELDRETENAAAVDVIDPAIDPASGTFGLRLVLPNENRSIPPGLRCTLQFVSEG